MAGAALTITFDTGAVRAGIDRLRAVARSPTPLLEAIGTGLVRSVQDRFDAGAGPSGSAWKPLSPAYAATKRGTGILIDRGRSGGLQGSITFQVQGTSVLVGSNKIYGAIHQFGGVIRPKVAKALVFRLGGRLVHAKSVTIPARPYLGFGATDETMVVRVTEAYLLHAWGGR